MKKHEDNVIRLEDVASRFRDLCTEADRRFRRSAAECDQLVRKRPDSKRD